MTPVVGNLFQDYSLAIVKFVKSSLLLPRIDAVQSKIVSITRSGTTGGGNLQHEVVISSNLDTKGQQLFKPGHCVLIQGSIGNDEQYVVLNVVGNVLILDKNYRRLLADQPTAQGTIKKTINVVYGNMDRAIAMIAQPLRNGSIDSPGVAVYLNEPTYKIEKSRPVENYYLRRYKDNNGNTTRTAAVPPMQEWELPYTINIWAVYQQEMDIMLQQIVTQFNPQKFLWIGDPAYGLDYSGDRMDRQHKGQWACVKLGNMSDASELEPGDADTRKIRYEIGLTVESAYVPLPFDKNGSYIGSISIETEIDNVDDGKPITYK